MSNTPTYLPYMESGTYPHVTASWRDRLRVAWRILWHGEFFPQPIAWYEPLKTLVETPFSHQVKRAVDKVSLEAKRDGGDPELRLLEARQWLRTYALEVGLWQEGMSESSIRFLIEFWVAKQRGKF